MWETVVDQLKEPFLLYSVILLTSASASIYITLKFLKIHNSRLKSVFYMIPLFIPIGVYMIFHPKLFVGVFSIRQFSVVSRYPDVVAIQYVKILSMVGLLCLAGLIFGIALLPVLYIFSDRIVCRFHGVIDISRDEKPDLFQLIDKCTSKAGVSMPRIGIIENLEPNAFTVGYGKRTRIVFSLGLLDILDDTELEAVVAHEVAHIKNHDFHLMALLSALKVVSFFNPIVYILSAAIVREREILADHMGRRLVENPERLGLALVKIWEGSRGFSKGFLTQFISGFFIVSEIRQLRTLFAVHPYLDRRLSYIENGEFGGSMSRDRAKSVLACFIIVLMMFSVYYPLYQSNFFVEGRGGIFVTAIGTKNRALTRQPYKIAPVQGRFEGFLSGPPNLQNLNETSVIVITQGNLNQSLELLNLNTKITITDLTPR